MLFSDLKSDRKRIIMTKLTESNSEKYARLIQNTTRFTRDIGFSPINRQSPKQIQALLNLNQVAVLDVEGTGFNFGLDSVIVVTGEKIRLSDHWTKVHSTMQVFVSPVSQHKFGSGIDDADLIPDKMMEYLNMDKGELLNQMVTLDQAKKQIMDFISDCQAVVLYRNSEQRFFFQMFDKKNWEDKVKIPLFKLQAFYKAIDQGLMSWQYSINGLLYRLKISKKVTDDHSKVHLMGLCLYKLQHIFKYLDINQITKQAKDYDALRPTIKDLEIGGGLFNNSINAEFKNRKMKKTYQFRVINQDNELHALAATDDGEPVEMDDMQNQINQRELLIKLNAQSLKQVFNELLAF